MHKLRNSVELRQRDYSKKSIISVLLCVKLAPPDLQLFFSLI